jgi:Sulfotransferase family
MQDAGFTSMTLSDADVIYIGYPKAASTFVGRFLENHPEVTTDRGNLLPFLYASSVADGSIAVAAKPNFAKTHVIIDEKVAESVCMIGEGANGEKKWNRYRLVPDAWDKVKEHVILDPAASALRLRKIHPHARVLVLIREQVDWLHSAYKHYIRHLPGSQRTFADFCTTPQGIALLQAGHFDQTIQTYSDIFGSDRVHVLRFDWIFSEPKRFAAELCAFVGISERPIPQRRENESNAQVARLRKYVPIVDRLPKSISAMLRPYAALLPGGRSSLLASDEVRILRAFYSASNQRTEKLLSQSRFRT